MVDEAAESLTCEERAMSPKDLILPRSSLLPILIRDASVTETVVTGACGVSVSELDEVSDTFTQTNRQLQGQLEVKHGTVFELGQDVCVLTDGGEVADDPLEQIVTQSCISEHRGRRTADVSDLFREIGQSGTE
jgi:hypothetical protein